MSKKARWCDDCQHHKITFTSLVCAKGHKPRFYTPKGMLDAFGWKRRCEDFRPIAKTAHAEDQQRVSSFLLPDDRSEP